MYILELRMGMLSKSGHAAAQCSIVYECLKINDQIEKHAASWLSVTPSMVAGL